MRESAGRRMVFAVVVAFAAGLLVYFYNPVDHVRADLRADTKGLKLSLEIAAREIEKACEQV